MFAAIRTLVVFIAMILSWPAQSAPGAGLEPGSVIYGAVPPLFGPDGLNSITARLDHLAALGVDVIWLTPINETDDMSAISYAVTDYEKIRADFGTEDDLQRLVRGAHERGMKVMLDFVANHTSNKHSWFTDAESGGRGSRTWDFYQRDSSGRPVHYFDWEHLPNLDVAHPTVSRRLVDAMVFWVRRFAIDGFRYDAAWGVQERNPRFWREALAELRKSNPMLVTLSEGPVRDGAYRRDGFDLAYDWTEKIGQWSWKRAFEDIDRVATHLRRALSRDLDEMKATLRFINNNDTGPRFISELGPEWTKVATVLTHTIPGVPLVFTGDEVGAEYQPYEDRPPLDWIDRNDLLPLHRRLAELREKHAALHSGDFEILDVTKNERVFTFVRRHGRDRVWVVLNFGSSGRIDVRVPNTHRRDLESTAWTDALTGRPVTIDVSPSGRASITMKALSALVLVKP